MIRIAVAEDNPLHADALKNILERYGKEHDLELELSFFTDGMFLLDDYQPIWDVIFLDIEMEHVDGMTTAEKIRKMDSQVILIFVTNLSHYAIRGYSVGALDYVLKPLKYVSFSLTMDKVTALLKSREGHKYVLNLKDGLRTVSTRDIYYVEVLNHTLVFHTEEGDFSVRGSIRQAEEELGSPFVRCNVCYLVNLRYVSAVTKETVIVGKYELAVSRRSRTDFLQAFALYLGKRDYF